jgi:hypothetical protein
MKTKIRQTSFSPRGNILGLIDAAQLQRRSTDAVMIPADVSTTHFGILRRAASEFRRCNQISPTLMSLLTQQVGMASKSNNAADNVYETLVMVSLGAR